MELEFKGSKNEWNACCSGEGKKSHYVFNGEDGVICAMYSNDPNCKEDSYDKHEGIVTRQERQANAKLISASKDLLEALQGIYNAIDSSIELTPEIMNDCKDAINKALK